MKSILALIILLLGLTNNVYSNDIIYCSHPEICKLVKLVIQENNLNKLTTQNLTSITGCPHEYEPSTLEIKKLLSAPFLITGPNELNPYSKKINYQRSKDLKLQTISLLFDQKEYLAYSEASTEAISHFWLYPRIYCSLKVKLEQELIQKKYPLNSIKACESKKAEDDLRMVLAQIKKPIILTHDALLPLFLNLDPRKTNSIVAIKGSGHHEEVSHKSIKKMYNALSASKVIWIQELGINIPSNIFNKIRATDIVIKINTANGLENKSFSVINELIQKLSPYMEKQ